MADDEKVSINLTISESQYNRLQLAYPEAFSDAERGRMALEEAIRAREERITRDEFLSTMGEVVTLLHSIHDELADEEE